MDRRLTSPYSIMQGLPVNGPVQRPSNSLRTIAGTHPLVRFLFKRRQRFHNPIEYRRREKVITALFR